jgi:hypothetical protein
VTKRSLFREWEVEDFAKSLILKIKFRHITDEYLYVHYYLIYAVGCYCMERFTSKWAGKK